MTTHHEDTPASPSILRDASNGLSGLLDSWLAFWFKPIDLTTLGVMRICAGLLTLYILFIYTYDLQALIGRDAWVDLPTANKLRKESPVWKPWDRWIERPKPAENAKDEEYRQEWGVYKHELYTEGMPVWSV